MSSTVRTVRIIILVGLVLATWQVAHDLVYQKAAATTWEVRDEKMMISLLSSSSPSLSGASDGGQTTSSSRLGTGTGTHGLSNTSSFTVQTDLQNATPLALVAVQQSNSTSTTQQDTFTFTPSNYAYSYVIGGCNPENGQYRGFLYNILVGTRILREEGAQADMVVYFQMSKKTNATTLPPEDVRLLKELGIKIVYIPKSELESFYDTVMNKFRILSLTQYRRVLLMDGDVMPIGNLDYLFRLSDGPNAILKENLIVSGVKEPANAGFFMLAPGVGEYERLTEIVRVREVEAATLTVWPKFDEVRGWGHAIDADDPWVSRKGPGGNKWNFHFAFSDQGLLYHWAKYAKQSVSVVSGYNGTDLIVQNWSKNSSSSSSEKTVLEARQPNAPFREVSKPRFHSADLCRKFMCDFVHFTGSYKPWMKPPPKDVASTDYSKDDPGRIWWYTLYQLNNEYTMGLNFSHWAVHQPPLGLYATFHDVERRIVQQKDAGNSTTTSEADAALPKGNWNASQTNTPQNDDKAGRPTRRLRTQADLLNKALPLAQQSNSTTMTQPTNFTFTPSNYAYSYVIGGCNPDNGQYRGFLYNILVSARILREEGAQADILVYFQMSKNTNATTLPPDDVRLLQKLGVKTAYIPKSELESFYDTVMNKFRILSLTQYRRVLLMDGDVMPVGNLDYLFRLSDGPDAVLKENLIVSGVMEPANAGFFMLAPGVGEYERLTEIVRVREVEAATLTVWPKFDEVRGWGHAIDDDDPWVSRRGPGGNKWNFHFAFSDQGLLYHWDKYAQQSVSVVSGYNGTDLIVQNWSKNATSGKTALDSDQPNAPFRGISKPRFHSHVLCRKFMCDFVHLTGSSKPWMKPPPKDIASSDYKKDDPTRIWWYTLYQLNQEYAMGLNFSHWAVHRPPLGLYATYNDVERRIVQRKDAGNSTIS